MKFKNILGGLVIAVVAVAVAVCCLYLLFCFQKERFQNKKKNGYLYQVEKFCDEHFGEDWGIDDVFVFNEKVIFITIQTNSAKINLSVLPDNRSIIVENITGDLTLKKRVYFFK